MRRNARVGGVLEPLEELINTVQLETGGSDVDLL